MTGGSWTGLEVPHPVEGVLPVPLWEDGKQDTGPGGGDTMSAVFVGVSADPPSFWTPESVPLRSGQGEGGWLDKP